MHSFRQRLKETSFSDFVSITGEFLLRAVTIVAENDLAAVAWYGFCVVSLQEGLPRLVLHANQASFDGIHKGNVFSTIWTLCAYLISYPLYVFWFTLVAMGLPVSMVGIPFYRFFQFTFCNDNTNNRHHRKAWPWFVLRLKGIFIVQYTVYRYIRHLDAHISGTTRTPLTAIVEMMEDVPGIYYNTIINTTLSVARFFVLCAIIFVVAKFALAYHDATQSSQQQRRDD